MKIFNHSTKVTNAELMLTDSFVKHIYVNKSIDMLKKSDVEIFMDEWIRVESQEVIYTDRLVKVIFGEEGLYDPSLINEQELEESPLGSFSSYRNKTMVGISYVTKVKICFSKR